jgi:uncharacterized protein (DUF2132 family)/predicted GIY-YIG superfamily endonuclease
MGRIKWTDEMLHSDALKYNHRSDWQKNSSGYQIADRRNLLDSCCQHMVPKINCYTHNIGVIYAFMFDDRTMYIGLSVSLQKRYNYHLREGIVNKKINTSVPYKFIILEQNIPNQILSEKEIFYIDKFKNNGWNLLNVAKGGSRGGTYIRIKNEELMKSASKYSSRTEWARQEHKLYNVAVHRKLVDKCCEHMTVIKRSWNISDAINEAQKYSTISEWQKHNKSSYNFLYRKPEMMDAIAHMNRHYIRKTNTI